jgi:ApaG protein
MAASRAVDAAVLRAVYRSLVRESKKLGRAGTTLRLADPLPMDKLAVLYGRGSFEDAPSPSSSSSPSSSPSSPSALQERLFGSTKPFEAVGLGQATAFSGADILAVVRAAFRPSTPSTSTSTSPTSLHPADAALRILASFNNLKALQPCRTRTVTTHEGSGAQIAVEVSTAPIAALPPVLAAAAKLWAFAYRVRVTNMGPVPVRILGRHWIFADSAGGVIEVPHGSPGIVGHTPLLAPGSTFSYMSGTQLAAPAGTMRGSLQVEVQPSRQRFDALIDLTALVSQGASVPSTLASGSASPSVTAVGGEGKPSSSR